jgi:hypothetical protein
MVIIDLKTGAYLLYKNPILYLLPSIGSVISIVSEAFFVIGLRNNNNQNYFPFSDILVLLLFFVSFTITYFQLVIISRKLIILKTVFKSKNYYNVIIVDLLIIYSIYALALADIGAYESDMRKSLASVKSDRFSLYTSKIDTHSVNTILIIISSGIPIILLSVIISMFFNAWIVKYILIGDQYVNTGRYGLYESLKNIVSVTIQKQNDKKKKIASLFVVTALISITGFVLTNIAVFPIGDSQSLYMLQFVILNIIGAIYSPFFLVCLFLTFLS